MVGVGVVGGLAMDGSVYFADLKMLAATAKFRWRAR